MTVSKPVTFELVSMCGSTTNNMPAGVSENLLYGFEQFILQTVQSGSWPAKVTLFNLVSLRVRLI
jgi:hypothetical protein